MQTRNGAPFRDFALDEALRQLILRDENLVGTRLLIKENFRQCFLNDKTKFPVNAIDTITNVLTRAHLPKFNRRLDNINGLGISVHDIHATRIALTNLDVTPYTWRATIKYECQDHFGLDGNDIDNKRVSQFKFFKIWFVLQHFEAFAFKPFMTNLSATVEIKGETV